MGKNKKLKSFKDFKKIIKGFTIIELLVAIVILGIIISLAVLVIDKYVLQGHIEVDKQLKNQLILSAKDYYNENKKNITIDDGYIIWYTTLKSNNYMTNDLVDSNSNSCAKSYVVLTNENNKNTYTSCITCDNDGYSNIANNKLCSESFTNSLNCIWENPKDILLGVSSGKNKAELTLACTGKNINNIDSNDIITEGMFSVEGGSIRIASKDVIKKNNKATVKAVVSYTATDANAKKGTVNFNMGSISAKGRKGETISNADVLYDKITIDGEGPSCSLSGPYKDNKLTTPVSVVKSGTKVYYNLSCSDEHKINGTIETTGFEASSSISNLNLEKPSTEDNNKRSALVEVTVTKGDDSKLTLTYMQDQIYDELDNYNKRVTSKVNGSDTSLVIDDQAPTCTFSGPASDINIRYSKTRMDTSLNSDYVYYSLKCNDENDIENNFKISQITNYNFSKVELVKTNDITYNETHIGYEYILKAYSGSKETTGYLSFNTNNAIDKVGNNGANKVIYSSSVKMIDTTKIPTCSIKTSYASDYRSATLTGSMYDSNGLTGYKWTNDQGTPSSYNSTSGVSISTSNKISENGYYYLHMKNENDLTGYCLAYVTKIKDPPPSTPSLSASDGISSGSWHKSNFTLSASGSGNNVIYYYGTSASAIYYTSNPSISSETTGTTHYAKACLRSDTSNCSSYTTYTAKLDKTAPTCKLSGTKTSGGTYSSGYWSMYDVKMSISSSDSGSGVSSAKMKNPFNSTYYTSYFTTSISSGKLGTGTVSATCVDNAGNSSSDSFSLKIDKQSPTVSLSPAGKKLSGATTITLSCTDGSGSGVDSKSMKSPSGSTYTSSFTLSKDGGTVTATCKDNVGNTSSISETYQASCTWTSWSSTYTYAKSCSSSSSDTKVVTCSSGYKKQTAYAGTAKYTYDFAPSASAIKTVTISGNQTHAAACKSKISFVTSCSSSNVGKYLYTSSSRNGSTAACYGKKCEKNLSGYTYIAGTPSYSTSCTPTGTKNKTQVYSTCETGYYKVTTQTRSCK